MYLCKLLTVVLFKIVPVKGSVQTVNCSLKEMSDLFISERELNSHLLPRNPFLEAGD